MNNRHDDYEYLGTQAFKWIITVLIVIALALSTITSIYQQEEECKVFRAQLVKDYSTWHIDLAKLPFNGYKQKLVSAVSYNESLIKYQQQCLRAYAN